jgi:uncharacterized protein YndB with AHSA1/START domain
MNSDRIEKQVLLKASRERVWAAIAESERFGTWFGVEFDGPFVQGERVGARFVPTRVDAQAAKLQEPWAGTVCDFHVEAIEPMRRFAYRWHAHMEGPEEDPEGRQMTQVEFLLEDADGGTRLTIIESGFERIPARYRAKAFADNSGGWEMQAMLIGKYLDSGADG